MPMTADQIKAANIIRATFVENIRNLEYALNDCTGGYVHVWPQYWLAIKILPNNQSRATAVDCATVTHRADSRYFVNGKKERSVLMSRREALQGALKHAHAALDDFNQATVA